MPDLRHLQQASGHRGLTLLPPRGTVAPQDGAASAAGPPPVHVALDLHVGRAGQPSRPGELLAGVLLAACGDPGLSVTLYGTVPDDWRPALDAALPWAVSPADPLPEAAHDDPATAVRARRSASVRRAARAVRDGTVDAAALLGPFGTAIAAATFAVARAPGTTTVPAAAILRTAAGRCVLLDVGLPSDGQPGSIGYGAVLGAQLAAVVLNATQPRVGLLVADGVPPALDPARARARALLASYTEAGILPAIRDVSVDDLLTGAVADVVVTDGFSGNVLRAGLISDPAGESDRSRPAGVDATILLGLEGVVVLSAGRAEPTAADVANALATAAAAHRGHLVDATRVALDAVVAWRRAAAGLAPVAP